MELIKFDEDIDLGPPNFKPTPPPKRRNTFDFVPIKEKERVESPRRYTVNSDKRFPIPPPPLIIKKDGNSKIRPSPPQRTDSLHPQSEPFKTSPAAFAPVPPPPVPQAPVPPPPLIITDKNPLPPPLTTINIGVPPPPPPPPGGLPPPPLGGLQSSGMRLKRINWEKLTGPKMENTVWGKVSILIRCYSCSWL